MQIEREKILKEITGRVTRDDGKKFTVTDRLDYIKSLLEKSDYEIYGETPLSVIYRKKEIELPDRVVLLSSHVDCVDEITNPNFEVTKKGNYKGTFDNAVTNAAVVIAMIENKLKGNVLIAFTGDEEENSGGARQVIEFLDKNNKQVIAIALDATYDLESEHGNKTTYNDASYTIDNLCRNTEENIVDDLFATANRLSIPYMVTRANGSVDYFDDKENMIDNYFSKKTEIKDPAELDEAIEYSEHKCCVGAFSLCIPTNDTDGDMHSNKMIKVKKNAFDEYIKAVVGISNEVKKTPSTAS